MNIVYKCERKDGTMKTQAYDTSEQAYSIYYNIQPECRHLYKVAAYTLKHNPTRLIWLRDI